MKQITFKSFVLTIVFALGLGMTSCKNKSKDNSNDRDSINAVNQAPVDISTDEALNKNVQDATKDYPGVQATVTNGEVTLAGTIERDRLPKLMSAIQGLNPKKVNNLLEVK
jgi:hypothetical protein